MLLDKIAKVTPTIEAEYDPTLVAAVRQAHETKERRAATLAAVHEMLTKEGENPDDSMNAFCSLIWDVESEQTKTAEKWRRDAQHAVTTRYPTLNVDDLSDFATPEEFFTALHALHGSDLGTSEDKALTEAVISVLGLDERYRGQADVSGKTLTAYNFFFCESFWEERVSSRTLADMAKVEKFMRSVMGEPTFSYGRDLHRTFDDREVNDFVGHRLAEGQDESIIRHVQFFKNGKARFTFKTADGLRKFLRALGAEQRMETSE